MESKVRAVLSGLGACGALGLFLLGVPLILVGLVGNPLPENVPAWSSVVAAVEGGELPAGVASSVLAVTVWIWWSQVVLSFAAEVRAAWRGRTARSLPLRALGMQPIIVRLVAIVVAAAGTVATLAQPALAATPSFAEITVPMNAGRSTGEQPGDTTPAATPATVVGPLAAVAGSPPAPILGLPVTTVVEVEPAAPTPVLGTPVPGIPGESQPRPDVTGGVSTSARWDPVLAPETAAPADQAPVAQLGEPGWVVVKPGDSLWLLAEQHLGDALRWPDIFELNAGPLPAGGTLRDPNLIHPGWRLRLPSPDPPKSAEVGVPAVPSEPATR